MVKYAVIGTSWITEEFIAGANLVEGLSLAGVYSRSAEKGKAFAARFGAPRVFTDLEELARADIDAVYIASPNSLHVEQSRYFLKNNKNILCEKPAAIRPEEMEELQSLAKSLGLVYMEAIMFMHSPVKNVLADALEKIGKISSVRFDFSQLSSRFAAYKNGENPNIFNPEMAGGCLMDLGCYCIYPAVYFFGEPKNIFASAGFLENGADAYGTAVLDYDTLQATLTYSKIGQDRVGSQIIGESGTVTIASISKLTGLYIIYNKDDTNTLLAGDTPKHIIMSYEAQAWKDYIVSPQLYSAEYEIAQNTALAVCRVSARIRQMSGVLPGIKKG